MQVLDAVDEDSQEVHEHVGGNGFECMEFRVVRLGKVTNVIGDRRNVNDGDHAYDRCAQGLHPGVGEESGDVR